MGKERKINKDTSRDEERENEGKVLMKRRELEGGQEVQRKQVTHKLFV